MARQDPGKHGARSWSGSSLANPLCGAGVYPCLCDAGVCGGSAVLGAPGAAAAVPLLGCQVPAAHLADVAGLGTCTVNPTFLVHKD